MPVPLSLARLAVPQKGGGRLFLRPVLLSAVFAALIATLEVGGPPSSAEAVSFTVNSTADAVDADPGDGDCATETGECTLRAAVQETNALSGPDEITLPAGTSQLTIPGRAEDAAATGDLDITDDITVTGAGRDATVIDGGQLDRIFHARLYFHNQLQVNLSDLTVRNGKAELVPTIGETLDGGGLYLGGGVSGALTDVKVTGNSSMGHGGGIWIGSAFASFPPSSVDLTRVEVSGNSSDGNGGGGIYTNGVLTLTDSLISSNSAGPGGGIYNDATLNVIRSEISSNEAATGGGVFNTGTSSFTIVDSIVTANHSVTSAGIAAAGTTVIKDSAISDNIAAQEGGGLLAADGSITLAGVTISGNTAGTDGGGVYVWAIEGQGLAFANSTISGNEADRDGGGIFVLVGTVELTNTTIAYNDAASGGAVAFSNVPAAREVHTANTVLSNNTPSNCTAQLTSNGHNLEDADTCGLAAPGDLTNVHPMLGPLADNGGPTLTHALLDGSSAIDASAADGCPDYDQRGAPRPFNGDGADGPACDIGAYEFGAQPPPPPPHVFGDVDCSGAVEAVDALAALRDVAALPPLAACLDVADVNCNGAVDAADALLMLRYVAALPMEPPPGCPPIGTLQD